MNPKSIVLFALLTSMLSFSMLWKSQQIVHAESLPITSNRSIILAETSQTSTLSLSARDLSQPHILSIDVPPNLKSLRGEIILDGQAIASLNPAGTSLNLAPRLSPETHMLKIFGTYQPVDATISVRFNSPQTQVSQSSGGNGTLNLNLVLEVS
jgi:hypothetical protein